VDKQFSQVFIQQAPMFKLFLQSKRECG